MNSRIFLLLWLISASFTLVFVKSKKNAATTAHYNYEQSKFTKLRIVTEKSLPKPQTGNILPPNFKLPGQSISIVKSQSATLLGELQQQQDKQQQLVDPQQPLSESFLTTSTTTTTAGLTSDNSPSITINNKIGTGFSPPNFKAVPLVRTKSKKNYSKTKLQMMLGDSVIAISSYTNNNILYSHGSFAVAATLSGEDDKELATVSTESMNPAPSLFSIADIEQFGASMGILIKSSITGPSLRLDAFRVGDEVNRIGYLSAFIRPGVFHLDTIQVKNRRQVMDFKRDGWKIDGPGMSFLLGSWALCWASQFGCKRAQLLAVNDSEVMHRILVALYSR